MRLVTVIPALLLLASPALAQTDTSGQAAAERVRERAMAILGIPTRADEIRREGVPDSSVQRILDILIERDTPPETVEEILTVERDVLREGGPRDNFGAFVQAQLAQGLRGRALADAIRAEHARQGRGPGARGGQKAGGPPGKSKAPEQKGGPPGKSKAPEQKGGPPAGSKRPLST
jgi:hypothetical protein